MLIYEGDINESRGVRTKLQRVSTKNLLREGVQETETKHAEK